MNAVTHLARRGYGSTKWSNGVPREVELPTWGIIMLGSTALVFLALTYMIEYTFGRIIPTLLMIESPQENIAFEALPSSATEDAMRKDVEPTQARPQLITSSFRKSIRQLRSVGGFRARFRGLSMFVVYGTAVQFTAGTITSLPLLNLLPTEVAYIAAAVLCAQFSLAWTHIVISEPSPKSWFRRFPPTKMWKKIAAPTAALALAEQVAIFLPIRLALLGGVAGTPDQFHNMTSHEKVMMSLAGIGALFLSLGLSVCLIVPASVVLTRVQASLLPDTMETIVPFDRSFGGKVIPEIVGGSGVLGMRDAWRSFDWASRVRLVKAYLKVCAMQLAVFVLFITCMFAQLFLVLGKNWSKIGDGNKDLK